MRKRAILQIISFSVIAFFCSTWAYAAEASCEITDYGLIVETTEPTRALAPQTVTGVYSVIKSGDLSQRTTVVPATLGVHFGVVRTLSNIPEGEKADLVISHPKIVTPTGQSLTRSVIPASPTSRANGYRLDEPFEVVVGEWTFEFFYRGKSLCRQSFQLVPPEASK
jgi:hypothetical protein